MSVNTNKKNTKKDKTAKYGIRTPLRFVCTYGLE